MTCTNPFRLIKTLASERGQRFMAKYPEGILIPCGKCLNCRIAKREEWAMRCLHELDTYNGKALFVTLTYKEEKLPENKSLKKRHLVLFFKRLRKHLDKENRKIRYYACGEYGEETQRPHYHAIIYGVDWDDRKIIMDAWPYAEWSVKTIRDKSFGAAEKDSIRYVAQYIDKKLSGDEARAEYHDKSREPVFKIQSLGIGKNYCDKIAQQLLKKEYITHNGIKKNIPRYYKNRINVNVDSIQKKALEKETEIVLEATGMKMTETDLYRYADSATVRSYQEQVEVSNNQRAKNKLAKIQLKQKKI